MIRSIWIIVQILFFAQVIFAQKQYQLAPPLAGFASVFFNKTTTLSFEFNQPGSSIRYTTDGSEPVTSSQLYQEPLIIRQNAIIIKARSFATGFIPSETVAIQFFSKGKPVTNMKLSNGASTLIDNKSGGTNHGNQAWLGFDSDSVVIDLFPEQGTVVSKVLLHGLNNQGAWIFPPARVDVYSVEENTTLLLKSQSFETIKEATTETKAIWVDLPENTVKQLRIVVFPIAALPDWHPGKGNKAWLFMDEIKLY
jgi:Fn3 associated